MLDMQYKGFNPSSHWNGNFNQVEWLRSLRDAKEMGANSISITTTHYVGDRFSTNIYANEETEDIENVASAIRAVQANGMKAVLKPHIDTNGDGWRGRINPADKDAFFASYTEMLLEYARVGEENGADMLVIGTEMMELARGGNREYWADMIADIREVYSGKIMYAGFWYIKADFLDLVDVIGVDPYVPLVTDDGSDSVEALYEAWEDPDGVDVFAYWRYISELYDKPLVFAETGFRSRDGTAATPWAFSPGGVVDQQEQANLFEAAFRRMDENDDFVDGVFVWGLETRRPPDETNSDWATGYTPQNKLAAEVIARWYDAGNQPADPRPEQTMTFALARSVADAVPSKVAVVVDQVVVGEFEVTELNYRDFGTYSVDFHANADLQNGHDVKFYLLNAQGGVHLHVDWVEVNGVRYEVGSGDGVDTYETTYSKGRPIELTVNGSDFNAGDGGGDTGNGKVIEGTAGNDVLELDEAGTAVDALGGDDRLIVRADAGAIDMGDGTDTITVSGDAVFSSIIGAERFNIDAAVVADFSAVDTKINAWNTGFGAVITGGSDNDSIRVVANGAVNGGAGNDYLFGSGQGAILVGGEGNDSIALSEVPAFVDGGAGNDRVVVRGEIALDPAKFTSIERWLVDDGASADFSAFTSSISVDGAWRYVDGYELVTGSGNDTVRGNNGGGLIMTGAGNDTVLGGKADDVIAGGAGADELRGGGGSNVFVFDAVDAGTGTDLVGDFDAGRDTLRLEGYTAANVSGRDASNGTIVTAQAADGDVQEIIVAGTSWNALRGRIEYAESGSTGGSMGGGGNGAPVVGTNGNDSLRVTKAGSDVTALAGNDRLELRAAPGTVDMGAGTDTIVIASSMTLRADQAVGVERFEIGDGVRADLSGLDIKIDAWGTGFASTVLAGSGDDSIRVVNNGTVDGGAGNDFLFAAGTNTTLSGGTGNDTFIVSITPGSIDGGDGFDRIVLKGSHTLDEADYTSIERWQVDSGSSASFANFTTDLLVSGPWSGTQASVIVGGSGNDMISSNTGSDTIFGGAGNDTMSGGAGDDRIGGGSGTDFLTGGSGADQFMFDRLDVGTGMDTITDFEVGVDRITLEGYGYQSFTGEDVDGGAMVTVVHDDEEQQIFVRNVAWVDLENDISVF